MELLLYVLIVLVCLPFIIRWMAETDFCFTYGLTNHVKFIERGGTRNDDGLWVGGVFSYMIEEVPGFVLDDPTSSKASFTPMQNDEGYKISLINRLLRKTLGVYWFGISPFYHVKNFYVLKEKENLEGTGPANWIKDKHRVLVTALRVEFPRPFIFTDVELADRLTVHVKVPTKVLIVKPYIPVYHFTDDFFTQMGSAIQRQVIDHLAEEGMTVDKFLSTKKGGAVSFTKPYEATDSELNQELLKQVGLKVTSIYVNDWEPGDAEIVKAIQKKGINKAQGEAEVTKAEFEANATRARAKGDADAVSMMAEARGEYVKRTRDSLGADADANVAARATADVLEMEAAAGRDSKLTTLVKDRSSVVVPVGGDKK